VNNGNIPNHIAIIPDGNRRWARSRGLAPWEGHSHGRNTFHKVSEAIFRAGIPYSTFWIASESNLIKRSATETRFLVSLFKEELAGSIREALPKNEIRLKVFGRWAEIVPDENLASLIDKLQRETAPFSKRQLTLLFGYDGKRELTEAVRQLVKNNPAASDISYELIKSYLWTAELPPCDLVIRTGEEKSGWAHQSAGFLMCHAADSLFYSTRTFWPDFSEDELSCVFKEYGTFERRFGA